MRSDRETLAWVIVWSSFAVFCLSCVAVFLGGRWYLLTATDPQQAFLKVTVGTVFVRETGKTEWTLATPEMPPTQGTAHPDISIPLKEGYAIRTDRTSQALVTLFDDSAITLLPDTELTFSSLRLSRFSFFAPLRNYIGFAQKKGKTVIGVAPSTRGTTRFEIDVPQGSLSLSEGSYTLDVNSSLARVKVKDGKAAVTAKDKTVEAVRGQRIDTFAGGPPRPPESASIELIANGSFKDGLDGWRVENAPGFPEGMDLLGTAKVIQDGGAPAISFLRMGSKGTHNETRIIQDLDQDVSDFTKLQLSIEFKLVMQNVSGGGYMGSEYPLLVRVYYRSDQGETYIIKGFYYQNDDNNRTDNGEAVPHNSWFSWTMPENLMTTLIPVPRKITRIELGASGHDYASEVRNISLSGE